MIINLTDSAKVQLKEVVEEKGEEKPLRIYIAGYGWGGPSFGLALDELKDDDKTMDVDGLKFVYGEELEEIFEHFTVDYTDSGFRKGFTVLPNTGASSSC